MTMFTSNTEAGEMTCGLLHILGTTMPSWVACTGGYFLGTPARNALRNAWETVVM
jgi:hypothetical protein